tara:strand:+ start:2676 stop:3620 length:945 start_codon:yes stop_codon:yes gene_type:complete
MPEGDTETNRPVIIYMHGGSFYLGDKSMTDCVDFCESFAKRGYVCASINYRLSNIFSFLLSQDVQLETVLKAVSDANAAVRFFRKDVVENGNTYGVDPETIFAGGYSAGSVIAIHQGFVSDISELPQNIQNLTVSIGGTIEGNSGNDGYSSEISGIISLAGGIHDPSWINSHETPIVSVQGTNDNTIDYYCAPALNNPAVVNLCGAGEIHPQADLVGLHNDKLIFNGEGHGWAASGNSNQLFLDALDFYSNFLYPLLPCNNISNTETHNSTKKRKLIKVVDVLGREVKNNHSKILFYIYDNGVVEKKLNNEIIW